MEEYQKKACPTCGADIVEERADECRRNVKIINFLQAEDAQPLVQGTLESIPCPKHPMKIIDYFCKTCSASVCSKCIYDDHNGHSLMQIDEMSNSLKQNVIDLRKMLDNSYRLIFENQGLLGQVKEELERLMELQLNNIQDGFAELQRKLEEKKQDIIMEFERKYKREEQRLMNKEKIVASNQEELQNIE